MSEAERIVAERIDTEPTPDIEQPREAEQAAEPPEESSELSAERPEPAELDRTGRAGGTEEQKQPVEAQSEDLEAMVEPPAERERDPEAEPEWLLPEEER
jgi:hypothetical protein